MATALQHLITSCVLVWLSTLSWRLWRMWSGFASRCFYQLCQLWSVRPALAADNARMLAHAFIASRVDYCNSILYQTAAVHLRPHQLVLNAAACMVVKKRKWDSITPTIRDNLHWLLVRQRIDLRFVYWSTSVYQLAAPYLLSMISPVSAVCTCRHLHLAGQGDLVVPRTRTAGFGPRSFLVAGLLAWNSLPLEINVTSLTLGTILCSHHNFYYNSAWNVNSVTKLKWTIRLSCHTLTNCCSAKRRRSLCGPLTLCTYFFQGHVPRQLSMHSVHCGSS